MENQESFQSNNDSPIIEPTQPPVFESQQSISPKKNSWLVPFLLLFILLLLGSTGFFGYHYFTSSQTLETTINYDPESIIESPALASPKVSPASPSPASVTSEQTYTDKTYNFSFNYPHDWEVRDLLANKTDTAFLNETLVYLGIAPISLKEDVLGMIKIEQYNKVAVLAEIKNIPTGTPVEIISESEIVFLNLPATEIITQNSVAQVQNRYIVFTKDGYTYTLSGDVMAENTVVNQILESFDFGEDILGSE